MKNDWVKNEWLEFKSRAIAADGIDWELAWLATRREIAAYGRALLLKGKMPDNKFVVYGHGRTGSELLFSLLRNQPKIVYEGEILNAKMNKKILAPELYIQGRCAKFPTKVYSFKVKIYQLTEDQGVEPEKFMLNLHRQGWKIIYLKRNNILRNAVSCLISGQRKKWHDTSENPLRNKKISIDIDKLFFQMERRESYAEKDKEILEKLDYMTVVYEEDLLPPENHQKTCDRIFDYVGIESVPVKTKLVRTTSNQMSDFIENYEELEAAVNKTKYAEFLGY